MKRITKRDILFFILGAVSLLMVETMLDWQGTKQSFIEGFKEGTGRDQIESSE